ncbi:FIST C-terminal domain-containing protein [Schlegelella sp. S2-27]|uniref:FIST C-terminal domain-containing protein n=1 Tax=Caldimonas mangrovi TaxID=2944811 RepID=A0ABT0YSC6_9BURK|nr:FIST N-terminal domain-containing protein [Caldimonas mangrovi]MCM5681636.1 FIST C-terminal domain-containing protein [Caldimonas mangrovi]
MNTFLHAHAMHPDWRMALSLVLAQLDGQRGRPGAVAQPTLGWLYLTDHHAAQAEQILAHLTERHPGTAWVGAVGVGVMGCGVEYFDEPALSVMLGDPPRDSFRVFSGVRPLPQQFAAHAAQVHADPGTPDMDDLVGELAARTASGYLFGGLAAARTRTLHVADEVFTGGLSGVAFDASVPLISRVTQGCRPVGPARRITRVERNVVATLDDEPALDCLLRDLAVDPAEPRKALPRLQTTLVGLSDAATLSISRAGQFGVDTRVRHLIGIDPRERGIAVADQPETGMQLAFCSRDAEAARRDLVRICTEIREELEPESLPVEAAAAFARQAAGGEPQGAPLGGRRIAGAVYVSCAGRGGPHFGGSSAELQIVRHALGDVPLTGFFAGGEIARHHLYGYTGVLTVFTAE